MSELFNVDDLTQMASAMGIPPGLIQAVLRDPQQLQRIKEQAARMMGTPSVDGSDADGKPIAERLAQTAKLFKENSERERQLPAMKAPTLTRKYLFSEMEQQRQDFRMVEHDSENTKFYQTYVGLHIDYSTTSVPNLDPSMSSLPCGRS